MATRDLTLNRRDLQNALRVHSTIGANWGIEMATDYWLVMNSGFDIAGAASTATGDELPEVGWVATSLVNTAGSGGDFGATDATWAPNHLLTNASGDLLSSPNIFGSYDHMEFARQQLQQSILPRRLVAEFFGSMTVHSADEPRSGWGFIEAGGSPATEADQLAFISSDGTNFQIGANAGTPINGAADDALWHKFKIVLNRITGLVTWQIDGTEQTMASTLAITGDVFPAKFGFHALTTNRPALGPVHIYYDYGN